jgi:hypothetical protein
MMQAAPFHEWFSNMQRRECLVVHAQLTPAVALALDTHFTLDTRDEGFNLTKFDTFGANVMIKTCSGTCSVVGMRRSVADNIGIMRMSTISYDIAKTVPLEAVHQFLASAMGKTTNAAAIVKRVMHDKTRDFSIHFMIDHDKNKTVSLVVPIYDSRDESSLHTQECRAFRLLSILTEQLSISPDAFVPASNIPFYSVI